MYEKLNIDENTILFDPCVGVSSMLLYAVENLGVKIENCHGIKLDKDNVAVCHKLGLVNIIQGDATKCIKVLAGINIDNMKIIMNPPYTKKVEVPKELI